MTKERQNRRKLIDQFKENTRLETLFAVPHAGEYTPERNVFEVERTLREEGFEPFFNPTTGYLTAKGNLPGLPNRVTQITYDKLGRTIETLVIRNGEPNHLNRYFYDDLGRLVLQESTNYRYPLTTSTQYIYPNDPKETENYAMSIKHGDNKPKYLSAEERIKAELDLFNNLGLLAA